MFQGSMVALVTPMDATGAVDEGAFKALIEKHIAAGTKAIAILGTTGEGVALTGAERQRLIELVIETANDEIPIIVGTGSCSTVTTIYQTEQAMELGADACLIVTPYYNKPTQEGLFQHFRAVADAVPVPIILYNVPSRTGCDLSTETVEKLSHIPNIIGLKEASGNLAKAKELLTVVKGRLDLFSGDDASALAFILQGGKGVISVTANVAPKKMHDMCQAALKGKIEVAGPLNTELMPLHKKLFIESNPIPVKWALQKMGWIKEGIRLPLTTLAESFQAEVEEAMKIGGVI